MSRRKAQVRAISRSVTFGPAVIAPLAGWLDLGKPLSLAGLGGLELAGLMIWPLLVLVLACGTVDALRGACVPRRWRIAYRQRQIRRGIPRERQRSSYISARLRRVTYFADRYRCTSCGACYGIDVDHLEVDHLRPWRWGGLTTLWNCGTLCQRCNKLKLDYWRERDGYVHYARSYAIASPVRAAVVLARLRRHRWNPLRWLRAAWAIAI